MHFAIVVFGNDVREQLAPYDGNIIYDEYDEKKYNSDAKWDYWTIGGRWSNYFLLKPEVVKKRGLLEKALHGKKDSFWVNTALKKEIDWDNPKMENKIPYGFVKDGKWFDIEDFQKNWNDKKGEKEYDELYLKTLKELPEDTRLTIIDIHM